jgi:hypothetical protein
VKGGFVACTLHDVTREVQLVETARILCTKAICYGSCGNGRNTAQTLESSCMCRNLYKALLWPTVFFLSPSLFCQLVHSRCRGLLWFHLITLRHTPQSVGLLWTRDRPVAETSTWQHKHCTRQIFMLPVGFEPTVPASGRPQTQALDPAAAGIGNTVMKKIKWLIVRPRDQ